MVRIIDGKIVSGSAKAAALLLALSPESSKKLFSFLEEDEIRQMSATMAQLGVVESKSVEYVIQEFIDLMQKGQGVLGSLDNTKRLLSQILGEEGAQNILAGIHGSNTSMWERLVNVNEETFTNFLQNEHPQTIAVVLSRIKTDYAAKIFSKLQDPLSMEVMLRMLNAASVKRDVLDEVESGLKFELMEELSRSSKSADPHQTLAEIFNAFDRNTETRFMTALEEKTPDSAERIKSLMFTFRDLIRVDSAGIQMLIRQSDKSSLALALKGAPDLIKDLFFSSMSERASKLLKEDIAALGMVRIRDVDEAQAKVVVLAKELADAGEITISEGSDTDEMVL
ncbi:MAG: flagellar motor switch protein FliG [Alphaproteobacteria bacterium]